MTSPRLIAPLTQPPDCVVNLPGSKSLTNRALIAAALAEGESTLDRTSDSDDSNLMVTALRRVGIQINGDPGGTLTVQGCGGTIPADSAEVHVGLAGTVARFLPPFLACGTGPYLVDAAPPMRQRPMADLIEALEALGANVESTSEPGHLPLRVRRPAGGALGADVTVRGDVSSQFMSGLLLSAPCYGQGLRLSVKKPLVSKPYLSMTVALMAAFGVSVEEEMSGQALTYSVPTTSYEGRPYEIEPDASSASYFMAAAAMAGGTVTIPGLGFDALQGDLAFAKVLAGMGAQVSETPDGLRVRGTAELHGIDVNMVDHSDTVQTLAMVATKASSPTTISGIGFIRGKESDRIGDLVTELTKRGIEAEELDDGIRIHPGKPTPGLVETYDDHRMAMSFALLGLGSPGIAIADPGVVSKSFPRFWEFFDGLYTSPEV